MRFLTLFLLFILFSLGPQFSFSQTYEIPKDTHRIVFLGNSITYNGKFISFIDFYLRLKYPDKQFEIINLGLPSETVSGLSEPNHAEGKFPRPDLRERLNRVLDQTKPDLIVANYGMNDGIYLPFDEVRFEAFKNGMRWLHQEVEKSGAEIIHVTPPIFDERKDPAYANVLDIYANWLVSQRSTESWKVIDLHWPMRKKLEELRAENPDFAFAKDAVHPDEFGHWFMAKEILSGIGEQQAAQNQSIKEFLEQFPNGPQIFQLIHQSQEILRDAWLRQTKHLRPGLAVGLPMDEANQQAAKLNSGIQKLLPK